MRPSRFSALLAASIESLFPWGVHLNPLILLLHLVLAIRVDKIFAKQPTAIFFFVVVHLFYSRRRCDSPFQSCSFRLLPQFWLSQICAAMPIRMSVDLSPSRSVRWWLVGLHLASPCRLLRESASLWLRHVHRHDSLPLCYSSHLLGLARFQNLHATTTYWRLELGCFSHHSVVMCLIPVLNVLFLPNAMQLRMPCIWWGC